MSAAHTMVLGWLAGNFSAPNVEKVARYMSKSLRIGGLKSCRALVIDAINAA